MANAEETERTSFNADAWGAGIYMLSPQIDIKTSQGVITVDNALKAALDALASRPVVDAQAVADLLKPHLPTAEEVAAALIAQLRPQQ